MNLIKKNLSYINIAISFLILIIFNNELLLPKDGPTSLSNEKRSFAEKRSTLIEWGSSSWSGVILSSELNKIKVISIIHEELMGKIENSKDKKLKISITSGKNEVGKIKKWNQCNELSVIEIESSNSSFFWEKLKLDSKSPYLSQPLFSFGHPLGLNLHYSEGYLSSLGNKIKPCGMITSGFSGGTIPGQTGSGVWNSDGELSGLIVATSAFPIKTVDKSGNIVGTSVVPVTFLGRFIPASEIKNFIK